MLQLRGALSVETPADNLRRHFDDDARVDTARRWLDRELQSLGDRHELALLLLDLDRSIVVRQRGIGAKVYVVDQLRRLLETQLPSSATLMDSGSRDEMLVVLPREGLSGAMRLAQELHELIGNYDFRLASDGDEFVRLTVSIGVAAAPKSGMRAFDLIWAASEALQNAKKTRNTVCSVGEVDLKMRNVRLYHGQWERLQDLAVELERTDQSLLHDALARLFVKHKGQWHWAVTHWDLYHYLLGTDDKDI